MLYVSLSDRSDREYSRICDFASRVYREHYNVTLTSFPEIFTYTYDESGTIHGSFGINTGEHNNPLLTESHLPHITTIGQLFDDPTVPRSAVVEFGTRAASKQADTGVLGGAISLVLAVKAFEYAFHEEKKYAIFTTNRTVQRIARALNVTFSKFGTPDLSTKSQAYRDNWQSFFQIPQFCWGARIADTIPMCHALEKSFADSFVFIDQQPKEIRRTGT